jgi:hypothetical protein
MTIDLGNNAKNKCKLKEMCPHDSLRGNDDHFIEVFSTICCLEL